MEESGINTGDSSTNERGFMESELVTMISGFFKAVVSNALLRTIVRKAVIISIIGVSVIFVVSLFIYIVPALQEMPRGSILKTTNIDEVRNNREYKAMINTLKRDIQRLEWKYNSLTPGQSYLVINTTENRFSLYRNKKLIREGFCSSGSYTRLSSPEGDRHWIFKTPRGMFRIQQKIVRPLWIRPDWSFVEEGLPIPPADHESRFEYGTLGDYAMSLGDGYLIHGTLYKRFLGMPVTHGCVRINDEDLEAIFNSLNIGSRVYIY